MKKLFLSTAAAFALLGSSAFAQTYPAVTTNESATITAGGTFQVLLAAGSASNPRRSLTIQNNNTNGDSCWLFIGSGSASEGTAILLQTGIPYARYYPYVPSDELQVTCASTSDTIYADVQ